MILWALSNHLIKIDNETNKPTDFQKKCRLSVGLFLAFPSPTSTLIGRYYFAYHVVAFLENPRRYYRFFGRRIGGMNVIASEGPQVVREGAV